MFCRNALKVSKIYVVGSPWQLCVNTLLKCFVAALIYFRTGIESNTMAEKRRKVLFICLGNICRSPMAMAIFRHLTDDWDCDSAALGAWHSGNSPDSRARKTCDGYGIKLTHAARQITKDDFHKYDVIMGMDHENIRALKKMAPHGTEDKVKLITEYDPEGADIVPDPYYDDGAEGFDLCYKICRRSLENFLVQQG